MLAELPTSKNKHNCIQGILMIFPALKRNKKPAQTPEICVKQGQA
jgi:hypothetical protein